MTLSLFYSVKMQLQLWVFVFKYPWALHWLTSPASIIYIILLWYIIIFQSTLYVTNGLISNFSLSSSWCCEIFCRDVDLTERLDHSSAVALLGFSLILAILRTFNVRDEAARVMVASPIIAFVTTHILYLNLYQFDYGMTDSHSRSSSFSFNICQGTIFHLTRVAFFRLRLGLRFSWVDCLFCNWKNVVQVWTGRCVLLWWWRSLQYGVYGQGLVIIHHGGSCGWWWLGELLPPLLKYSTLLRIGDTWMPMLFGMPPAFLSPTCFGVL